MKIAVLSGKGGTGKTTVSTNLSMSMGIGYVDCDVEEPNGFIFLKPIVKESKDVFAEYPVINQNLCTLCAECAKVCNFNALAKAGKEIVVFEKLCHGCGACKLVCKTSAISYLKRPIGKTEIGYSKDIECSRGILNVGEPMAVPVIKDLLSGLSSKDYLIDCPPGTSCNVVNSLKYADAAVLVTEPSEFGLHDLRMAVELVKLFNLPHGIVINKDDGKDNIVKTYSSENGIPLIGLIPYRMEVASNYSKGLMLCEDDFYKRIFIQIADKMREEFQW